MRGGIYGAEIEAMGSKGKDGFNTSAGGAVHEGRVHNCTCSCVEKSFAQRPSIRYEDADILHKSRRSRLERLAPRGTSKGKISSLEAHRARARQAKARRQEEKSMSAAQRTARHHRCSLASSKAGLGNMFAFLVRAVRLRVFATLLAAAVLLQSSAVIADQIPVRHKEALMHGFLALSTLEGTKLADGEMKQVTEGDRLSEDLIFRFKDGSIYEEKIVMTQKGRFQLLSDHVVEKGPSFKHPMETSIDTSTGQVTLHYIDNGKEKVLNKKVHLPPDLANGLMFTLVKDLDPRASQTTVSMLATTPKPRLVKVAIFPEGERPLSKGSRGHQAIVYDVKVQIGGIAGLLVRVARKQPADAHVWILSGEAPAFVKWEGPLYQGGPIWRIELATPAGFP